MSTPKKLKTVRKATDFYVDNFIREYDMEMIIEEIAEKYDLQNEVSVKNLGWLPFGRYSRPIKLKNLKFYETDTFIKPYIQPTDKRYDIFVLNISYGYTDDMIPEEIDEDENIPHYLGYILDNNAKEIWLLDSLTGDVLNEQNTGLLKFAKAHYPKYKIRGIQICSGCGFYEPYEDETLRQQNIFCHTWTLYFIFMILKGISSGYTIKDTVDQLNMSCGTEKENLKKIKQFAIFITEMIDPELRLPKQFSTIYIPARNLYEQISILDTSPVLE